MPEAGEPLAFKGHFTKSEFDRITHGCVPIQMEVRWFVFPDDIQPDFHRSWAGPCMDQMKFEKKGNESFVTEAWVNRNQEEYRNTDDNYDIELLSFLIDNFLRRKNRPFLVPSRLPKNLQSRDDQNSASGSAYPEAKSSMNWLDQVANYIQQIFRRKF